MARSLRRLRTLVVKVQPCFRLALAAFLTFVSTGCGSSSTTLLSPSPPGGRCSLTLDVSTSSIGSAGGSGTVRIDTNRECAWSLPERPSWVKLSQPQSTQGPAELSFVIEENRSISLRFWEVVVADKRKVISQDAALCTWSVSPAKISVDAAGGDVQATLATQEFCSWELPKAASWITMRPDRGQGREEITFRVARNLGGARSHAIRISTAVIEVAQKEAPSPTPGPSPSPTPPAPDPVPPPPSEPPLPPIVVDTPPSPCAFAVQPVRFTDVITDGAVLRVDVKTDADCQWTALSEFDWLIVPSDTKTGSGRIDVRVLANAGTVRSGAVTVAGQNVTIQQRGAPVCDFSLTPSLINLPPSGGVASVSLGATAGCSWGVTGAPNWITVSPATGSGSATLKVTATPNSGAARTAVLTVGGRELRVEQAQLPPCTFTVSPEQLTLSRKKQSAKIEVATQSYCEWSATSSETWARVPAEKKIASGTIEVKVEDNSRSRSRTAIVTIIGQSFSKEVLITQQGDD